MGFSLTVQEGKDVGRQETFDQLNVTVGRTSENDFVLLDPGVSRKHAVISYENGRCVIQDLGSANGIMVNGNQINKQSLSSGDKIALGPVVLTFEEVVDARAGKKRARSTSADRAKKALVVERESRRGTMTAMQAQRGGGVRSRSNDNDDDDGQSLAPVGRRRAGGDGSAALAMRRRQRSVKDEIADEEGSAQKLSISERARILRENKGAAGQIKLFMAERTPGARKAIYGGMIGVGFLFVCVALVLVMKQMQKTENVVADEDMSQRRFSLVDSQVKKVFGYGRDLGVNVSTRYELHFEFEVSETVPAIYYLFFDSKGVESADEVNISLNSVPLGNVNAGLGDYTKTQKLRLPKKHLTPGHTNEIMFDHTVNTRSSGQETWAISSVRLQMIPLPGCDARNGECEREAHQHYEVAEKMWVARQMAAENSYNALKNLNTSLLFLEAVDPKPEFTRSVQQMIREVEKHLDDVCSKTMLQIKRDEEMRNYQKVVNELKNGLLWYPGPDHPCRSKLEEKLAEYE